MLTRKILIIPSLVMAVALGGCSHDHHEAEDSHGEKPQHGDEITMEHEAVENGGITCETVVASDFREAVKAAGVIENTRGAERVIIAPASGVVSFGAGIVSGASVGAGQHLFSISSRGLEQSDATATIGIDVSYYEKEYRRAAELAKDDLIPQKEFERIKADYERAKAATTTVAAHSRNGVSVSSPIGGYIVKVDVAPGSFVNMGDPLAVVASSRRLMLRAEVSERHRNFVTGITGANIMTLGQKEVISLSNLHPHILTSSATSPEAGHFMPVYIEFDNPGMLGSGSIVETWLLGERRQGVISVPKSALVEDGGFFYVFVLDGDHNDSHDGEKHDDHIVFRKVEVETGGSDGMRVEIVNGLHEGDEVVVNGAVKVRMAGMSSSIPGHSHHH